MVHFGEFLKTWSLRSNIVTRQVSFNRTKMVENANIQKFKCDILSNFKTMWNHETSGIFWNLNSVLLDVYCSMGSSLLAGALGCLHNFAFQHSWEVPKVLCTIISVMDWRGSNQRGCDDARWWLWHQHSICLHSDSQFSGLLGSSFIR